VFVGRNQILFCTGLYDTVNDSVNYVTNAAHHQTRYKESSIMAYQIRMDLIQYSCITYICSAMLAHVTMVGEYEFGVRMIRIMARGV